MVPSQLVQMASLSSCNVWADLVFPSLRKSPCCLENFLHYPEKSISISGIQVHLNIVIWMPQQQQFSNMSHWLLSEEWWEHCLSNMDKVATNLAQWKYPKYMYPSWAMPKDLKVSPQAGPYCFYCESIIKARDRIAFCSSCIENYGNERHNIACGTCAHRIPEYCTCSPFRVTKGTYPVVDPYDVIIPIT